MFLRTLRLHQFRSYQEAFFEFCPSLNILCGPNAAGKTTILEAIHLLMTGRSFRTPHLQDLIKEGAAYFSVEAVFIKQGVEQSLKVFFNGTERQVISNHTTYRSFANLLGIFPGVCMTPEDSALVKGPPLTRRNFLDLQLAQGDPLYVHKLMRYSRAMRQRNCLLRSKNFTSLESWEYEMAQAACYLTQKRRTACEALSQNGKQIYDNLSTIQELFSISYKSTVPSEMTSEAVKEYYVEQFRKLRRRESELGYTLTGPHKDDLSLFLNEKEARYFASEGQQRSFVAALKLAEWELLKKLTEESPLMLIDDIGMSWDAFRKANLMQHLNGLQQVFITAQDLAFEFNANEKKVIELALSMPGEKLNAKDQS